MNQKRGVVISLVDRAKRLCSDVNLPGEITRIKDTMKRNGYPKIFVENVVEKRLSNKQNISNETSNIRYVAAPYIKATTEKTNQIPKYNTICD